MSVASRPGRENSSNESSTRYCAIKFRLPIGKEWLSTLRCLLARKRCCDPRPNSLPGNTHYCCDWVPVKLIENGDVVAEDYIRFLDDFLLLSVRELKLIQTAIPRSDECGRAWDTIERVES